MPSSRGLKTNADPLRLDSSLMIRLSHSRAPQVALFSMPTMPVAGAACAGNPDRESSRNDHTAPARIPGACARATPPTRPGHTQCTGPPLPPQCFWILAATSGRGGSGPRQANAGEAFGCHAGARARSAQYETERIPAQANRVGGVAWQGNETVFSRSLLRTARASF